jgi:lysozyme
MIIDLSHYDPAYDYSAVKAAGIVGVIFKATQGQSWTDDTYVQQQHAAKAEALKWAGYHFADSSSVQGQIDNFMRFCCPDPDEAFVLDWEDNGGNKMSLSNVEKWIDGVESRLGRPEQCILYGGNTIKEAVGSNKNDFLSKRRLWLCQYSSTPSWPTQVWPTFDYWQFTDGANGPSPHSINGVGHCDINSYEHSKEQLIAEWATGKAEPAPPPPDPTPTPDTQQVSVIIAAPPNVIVKVRQVSLETAREAKDAYEAHKRNREKEAR